jgi:hypothetical protein
VTSVSSADSDGDQRNDDDGDGIADLADALSGVTSGRPDVTPGRL